MNALMSNFDIPQEDQGPHRWEGFSEIDQAIRDNRLMEYRVKKSWADPWGRKLTVAVLAAIIGGFAYLIGASFGLW